jgi:hypothetical protein
VARISWRVLESISENANFRISPGTLDHLIASGGVPAIVYVIVMVIIDTSVDTGAISHGQNGDHSWGWVNSCLLNHNAIGNGAPLVNDASRSGETRDARCDKKNGFHGLSRCYWRIAAAEDGARIASVRCSQATSNFGRFLLDVMLAIGE